MQHAVLAQGFFLIMFFIPLTLVLAFPTLIHNCSSVALPLPEAFLTEGEISGVVPEMISISGVLKLELGLGGVVVGCYSGFSGTFR